MIALLADHVWQSTLFLLGAALLTLLFQQNGARVRYWIWFAASLKFLVPFAALVAIGQQFAWRSPRVVHVERFVAGDMPIPLLTLPGTLDVLTTPAAQTSAAFAEALPILLGIWLAGIAVMLARWGFAWLRLARIARRGTRLQTARETVLVRRLEPVVGIAKPLPVVASDAHVEPGVFGILAPVLLWPTSIGDRLGDAQVEAILKHELCHVRRRDNLTAAIHMAVQALFWFHPLVWWVGARLVEERERACDEDVVRLGSEPDVYAESILRTCQFYVESPLACMAGVTGSDLKKRMERIMTSDSAHPLKATKKVVLAAAAIAAIGTPVAVGAAVGRPDVRFQERVLIRVRQAPAGAPAQAPSTPNPTFEVASVKWNKSGEGRMVGGMPPGRRFTATNMPLRMIIRQAYQIQDFQMAGGPGWIDSDRFDIDARASADVGPQPVGTAGPMHLMLQALLADRFQLKVHRETRELPIFAMVLARTDGRRGPQLRTAGDTCAPIIVPGGLPAPPPPPPGPQIAGAPLRCPSLAGPFFISGRRMTMPELAAGLSPRVNRMVVDRTGLAGNFDFELSFSPDEANVGQPIRFNGADLNLDTPSIYTAVQEQLGLKLESGRGPVEVLVIDSVEHPTEN